MLGKMLIHGLVAAAILGSAAAVYAQVKDTGNLAPAAIPEQRKDVVASEPGDGYLRPTDLNVRVREDERRHGVRSERHRERHDRKRDHDDDDD